MHDQSVTSIGIELDQKTHGAVDLGLYNAWLDVLLREKGADLFRMKGVLAVKGIEDKSARLRPEASRRRRGRGPDRRSPVGRSRRRRGRGPDRPSAVARRQVTATLRPPPGLPADESWRRRGRDPDSPSTDRGAAAAATSRSSVEASRRRLAGP